MEICHYGPKMNTIYEATTNMQLKTIARTLLR